MTCERATVRSTSSPSYPGTSSGMITGASRIKAAVSAPRTSSTKNISVEARRKASRRSPRSSCSVKTGTKAAWMAASAKRLRIRFGAAKATVNADMAPETPK